jgi:predicted DNA-binding transcriptional regulator YafY
MAFSEYWGNMVFHRLDHITNMTITDKQAVKLRSLPGYESGINYKELASTKPYMYTDKPERIIFLADAAIIDQIIDWFGKDVTLLNTPNGNVVRVSLVASPMAVEHWAMQYINHVEIISPDTLRDKIKQSLKMGLSKYGGK